MTTQNGFVLGHSPPWPPETARGISAARKWRTLLARKSKDRLVALVDQRELTDEQKWQDICAELELPPFELRNVADVEYSLATGWKPSMAGATP